MRYIIILLSISLTIQVIAQNKLTSRSQKTIIGTILNQDKYPISYTNIIIQNSGKGTISNENGKFSINIHSLNDTNTVRFQCIGYKTEKHTVKQLKNNPTIILDEDIYKIDEILILGTTPNANEIIKAILKNKKKNYKVLTEKKKVFFRERSKTNILNLKLEYKKNKDFEEISTDMIQLLEEKTPRNTQSYFDILTDIYIKGNELKCHPIKIVALKEEDPTNLKIFKEKFNKLAINTKDNEFWKIKSGIFGSKISTSRSKEDSLNANSENLINIKSFKWKLEKSIAFSTFQDKKKWEFLYKINKYNFEIIGGTNIKNEKVYIIDFYPKKNGLYQGRLYVAIESAALIRADYKFAPNKKGKKIQLLGFGFENTNFRGSIYFEKKGTVYDLKYLSYKDDQIFMIDRNLSLLKKKKRILLNKKIKEIKFGINMLAKNYQSIELLVINNLKISDTEFSNLEEKKYANVTYVNQFNKDLWRNHITIEPTKEMKEYTKY